jgi:D-glycerate 3-kinase
MSDPLPWLQRIIEEEHLPASFEGLVRAHYLPLAQQMVHWSAQQDRPLIVGVNGAQGTGKSTLSKIVAVALEQEFGIRAAVISIDDIYHTKATRIELAAKVHPLLNTRGVPGTHDTDLGIQLLRDLKARIPVKIPSFDKSTDDRRPAHEWVDCSSPVDVILFEGWCIGAIAQEAGALARPMNRLEEVEDADGRWRSYVNDQLEGPYLQLFDFLDRLVILKAPDFECVHHWRGEQERKLRESLLASHGDLTQAAGLMDEQELARFIMHYERLTRWMFSEMPKRADVIFELAADHSIAQARGLK